jgi:Domain of unknown function (DUF4160)
VSVPELSRFHGIIIRMYMEAGQAHHTAHFHAYYQENVAVYAIRPVQVLAGALPRRQHQLVEAWVSLHQDELEADWRLLQSGRSPLRIDPLP